MNREPLLSLTKRLTVPYTAPYNEHEARSALHEALMHLRLPYEMDPFGNTVVRVRYGHPRRQVAFVAHLDHPGFRVTEVKGSEVTCLAEGGLPTVGIKGAKVIFPRVGSPATTGKVSAAKLVTHNGRAKVESLKVRLGAKAVIPSIGSFGVFDLPSFKMTGQRMKVRAADDAVGVAAVVAALHDLSRQHSACDVVGLFTRAEEVGFHGALAAAIEGRLLPRDTFIVSVECSRAYDHVAHGKGPVVRLGDRTGPFHPRVTSLLLGAAKELAHKKFAYQSALMSGGTTEATAFAAFDYASGGIALPLANYHNQGPRGVAAEEVDFRDLDGAVRLIAATALRAGAGIDDIDLLRNELVLSSQEGRDHLREAIDPTTGYPVGTKF